MFVLCVETKHCQVACGFDSDSCTYKTTEPNALKHWLCVPITCLSSQSSILLHPVLAFCNLYYKSEKDMLIVIIVWQKKNKSTNQLLCYCLRTNLRFRQIHRAEALQSVLNLCYHLHHNCGKVTKLYANAKCSETVTQSTSELLW